MPRRKKNQQSLPNQPDQAEPARSLESGRQNSLTSIQGAIHCPPPSEGNESRSELEELEVQHFIDTAAEIAFAIARRKQTNQQPQPDYQDSNQQE